MRTVRHHYSLSPFPSQMGQSRPGEERPQLPEPPSGSRRLLCEAAEERRDHMRGGAGVSPRRLGSLLLVGLVGAVPLSGCGSGDDEVVQATRLPAQRSPTAVPVTATSSRPIATLASEVPWAEAKAMILNGEVCQVVQLHSLKVTLHLRDGRRGVRSSHQGVCAYSRFMNSTLSSIVSRTGS